VSRTLAGVMPRAAEPEERFRQYAQQPHCVWLDTATAGQGISIIAAKPRTIFRARGRQIELLSPKGKEQFEADPFAAIAEQIARHRSDSTHGAAIGYFGYDLKNCIERLPAKAADDIGLPDCWFGFYDDPQVVEVGQGFSQAVPSLQAPSASCRTPRSALRSNFTRDSYCRTVLRAKEYIAAGDIYQVNLSQRFQCEVDTPPTELYSALRAANPAPYCAYLDIGEAQILSTSPECFLKMEGRSVITRPIKGTRPRGATAVEDERQMRELLASPKDNAELVMITDLERNDLGKVCEFGSVRVNELVRVETYATVHHLVSTVEGVLRPDVSHVDCVRACFPGGSITGAPKIRAMEIIDELEPHARGVYTGAIGFFGFNGLSHFNIAIRTAVYQSRTCLAEATLGREGGRLTFHAGGGIVADSEPEAEYAETLAKAEGIIRGLEQLRLR
jgi:para-aminobenzoate synthetase component I